MDEIKWLGGMLIAAWLGAISWIFRRHVNRADELEVRIRMMEQSAVTHSDLERHVDKLADRIEHRADREREELLQAIRALDKRLDSIHRDRS